MLDIDFMEAFLSQDWIVSLIWLQHLSISHFKIKLKKNWQEIDWIEAVEVPAQRNQIFADLSPPLERASVF